MTITLTREEAQQVLEHLDDLADFQQWDIDMHVTQYGEEYKPHRMKHMKEQLANTNSTIETLRARLAQPEPEPVAWMNEDASVVYLDSLVSCRHPDHTPLYTAPPQREWQGLTDEEIRNEAKNHVFDESFFNGAIWARGQIMGRNDG